MLNKIALAVLVVLIFLMQDIFLYTYRMTGNAEELAAMLALCFLFGASLCCLVTTDALLDTAFGRFRFLGMLHTSAVILLLSVPIALYFELHPLQTLGIIAAYGGWLVVLAFSYQRWRWEQEFLKTLNQTVEATLSTIRH